ncbi:MAG: 4Fe-4S binding protein [Phycisphaerales bacterium]
MSTPPTPPTSALPHSPSSCDPRNRAVNKARAKGAVVSLPVLAVDPAAHHHPTSRMGKWRAAVLILVHVIFIAHLAQWYISGMSDGVRETLTPIEPSESMATLEMGQVNAGFVMFCVAILATLIFGRFFCGWVCHVVALQDLCAWIMKKCGVHPKPWRSRLLLWVPLGLALYMFVWPTFRREVLERYIKDLPDWVGRSYPLRGFQHHFVTENFWATFAPWYVAIPFLLICGFATVYFMGAKAFCTYGCPYGGFFAPVDMISPGRIRVTDDCHQCGHCTSVCTSNVRVHEEVRDFGMVVDPGCMKCLDCVSACPNGALYWGMGSLPMLMSPRPGAKIEDARDKRRKRYDLTLREEVILAGCFLVLFFGFRGMYFNFFGLDFSIPMLMAVAMAGLGCFALHKLWRLLRDLNVRGPYWQLKLSGRVRPAGWLFALGAVLWIALGVQGAIMSYGELRGGLLYGRLAVQPRLSQEVVYAAGYKPTPQDQAQAREAIDLLRLAGPMDDGGIGFYRRYLTRIRLVYLYAVAGDLASAERELVRSVSQAPHSAESVDGLVMLAQAQGKPVSDLEATLTQLQRAHPSSEAIRHTLAQVLVTRQRAPDALDLYEAALKADPRDATVIINTAQLNFELGRAARAIEILEQGVQRVPKSVPLNGMLAEIYLVTDRPADALRQAGRAVELIAGFEQLKVLALAQGANHDEAAMARTLAQAAAIRDLSPEQLEVLAQIYESINRPEDAKSARTRAAAKPGPATPNPPRSPVGN